MNDLQDDPLERLRLEREATTIQRRRHPLEDYQVEAEARRLHRQSPPEPVVMNARFCDARDDFEWGHVVGAAVLDELLEPRPSEAELEAQLWSDNWHKSKA
jgi:hypothetical protein